MSKAEFIEYKTDIPPETQNYRPPTTEELLGVIESYYQKSREALESALSSLKEEGAYREESEVERIKKVIDLLYSFEVEWRETEEKYLSPDTPEKEKRSIAYSVEEWYLNYVLVLQTNGYLITPEKKKLPPYRIVVNPETGERTKVENDIKTWEELYFLPGSGVPDSLKEKEGDLLADLEEIRKAPKGGIVKVSKDLLKSQTESKGDVLQYIKDDKIKKTIQRKLKEGKYIAGTMEGLSGGGRYFKLFCLALSQTLNEQSKHYNTQKDLSGVPQNLISKYAGDELIQDKIKAPSTKFKGGTRPYPIIFLSWEDLALKMSTKGKIVGGKDIKQVRDYVLGGTAKKKDTKTGKTKEVFTPGLLGREFFIEGTSGIIGVPLMTKLLSLYPKDSPDKEVGIAVQLSPLFAYSNLIGYTSIRPDTIQLLGGGKQRELTLNLFMFLARSRGVPPQTGRRKGEFLKVKDSLLSEMSQGLSTYDKRPGLLEKHFREAVLKCIDAKILLPGKTREGGLKGYREEINPGGERISVFVFNPDYLKGEETLFTGVEDQ